MLSRSATVVVLLILGCGENAQPRDGNRTILQQSGHKITGLLSEAKNSCESLASIAKRQRIMLPGRRKRGMELYGDARTACNALITELIVAISPSSKPSGKEHIYSRLADIDQKCQAFSGWYYREHDKSAVDETAASHTEMLPEFISLATEVIKLINQRNAIAAEERRVFREQLAKCEWREWNEIP